jgi:hypothetical protein
VLETSTSSRPAAPAPIIQYDFPSIETIDQPERTSTACHSRGNAGSMVRMTFAQHRRACPIRRFVVPGTRRNDRRTGGDGVQQRLLLTRARPRSTTI